MLKEFAVQDYIKAITHLTLQTPDSLIKISHVAKKLHISNAAVNDMVKKLEKEGYIESIAYKGIKLMPKGLNLGTKLIRHHRLWEVFLYKILEMPSDTIHDEAEQLEHAASDDLMNRLDKYLEFPKNDPHGNPIPDKDGTISSLCGDICLSKLPYNVAGSITRFGSLDEEYIAFLGSQGIAIGKIVQISHQLDFDNSLVIKTDSRSFSLPLQSAKHIYIKKES